MYHFCLQKSDVCSHQGWILTYFRNCWCLYHGFLDSGTNLLLGWLLGQLFSKSVESDFFTSQSRQCSLIIWVSLLFVWGFLFRLVWFFLLVCLLGFFSFSLIFFLIPARWHFLGMCMAIDCLSQQWSQRWCQSHHGSAGQLSTRGCSLEITQFICLVCYIKAKKALLNNL